MTIGVVHLLVPLEHNVVFSRWLPFEPDCICVPAEGDCFAVRVWVDLDCLAHISPIELDDVPNHINLKVNKLHVEVNIGQIDEELASYIGCGRRGPSASPSLNEWSEQNEPLETSYKELGQAVFESVLKTVGRCIQFTRVEKGQYWLVAPSFDDPYSLSLVSHARVTFDSGPACEWLPPSERGPITMSMENESRFISADEWSRLCGFVVSGGRTNLVNELLANAEALLAGEQATVALIEAVIALEVAVNNFVQAPRADGLRQGAQRYGIDLSGLARLRGKLGLRGSLELLLPLIIDDESLPPAVLETLRAAVDTRGNVVHNRQWVVDPEGAARSLTAIRQACNSLAAVTISTGSR